MKTMRGKLARVGRAPLQRVMLWMASPVAYALNKLVAGNAAFPAFSRHGFHLLRKHYYSPVPDDQDLNDSSLRDTAELVGIDLNDAAALDLLEEVFPRYLPEFRAQFPLHPTNDPQQFHLVNGCFMAGDAHAYYSILRHFQPRALVEIGAGNSTLLAAAAARKNAAEGHKPTLIAVEPYPSQALKDGVPGLDQLLPQRLQEVDLELFRSLGDRDVLFIDSSHVLRPGGDVQRIFCEILPRLAPGVLVHVHDISLPKPYHQCYFDSHLYWNEQYLLQAFLTYNERFEVLWPGTHLWVKYPEKMLAVLPEIRDMREKFPLAEPSSFWMRVRK